MSNTTPKFPVGTKVAHPKHARLFGVVTDCGSADDNWETCTVEWTGGSGFRVTPVSDLRSIDIPTRAGFDRANMNKRQETVWLTAFANALGGAAAPHPDVTGRLPLEAQAYRAAAQADLVTSLLPLTTLDPPLGSSQF